MHVFFQYNGFELYASSQESQDAFTVAIAGSNIGGMSRVRSNLFQAVAYGEGDDDDTLLGLYADRFGAFCAIVANFVKVNE